MSRRKFGVEPQKAVSGLKLKRLLFALFRGVSVFQGETGRQRLEDRFGQDIFHGVQGHKGTAAQQVLTLAVTAPGAVTHFHTGADTGGVVA